MSVTRDGKVDPRGGVVVARVNSTSNPSKFYSVMRSKEGYLYCDCAAWRFQKAPAQSRFCKHTRAFEGQQADRESLAKVRLKAPQADVRDSPRAEEMASRSIAPERIKRILNESSNPAQMVEEATVLAFNIGRAYAPAQMSNFDVGNMAAKLVSSLVTPLVYRVMSLEDEIDAMDALGEPIAPARKPASSKGKQAKPSAAPAKAVRLITLNDEDE